MASTVSSTASRIIQLRGAFSVLAEALPAFSPGICPADASEYLAYYGLDMRPEFPLIRHGLGTVGSGGHRLAVHCWEQAGAAETLMLVHGYFDHVGLYGHLVRFGLARGANVVAFDLPGHGLSSGPQAEISDFAEYRQAIVDVLDSVAFLPGGRDVIAQSTGGAAVMDYLQCETNGFDRIVLLAPLVRPNQWWRIKLAHLLLHRFVANVPRGFADSSQDPEFLDFVRQDPLQSPVVPVCWVGALRRWLTAYLARPPCPVPLLVLQGDDDGTVDWKYNLGQIRQQFPAVVIETLPTGRHHLVNEDERVRMRMLEVIERYLRSGSIENPHAPGTRKTSHD